MKIQQLRYVCEIVDCGMNVTRAAQSLHTSQSGVSRYVELLERELGVRIFVREKNRMVGLTGVGKQVLSISKRALNETENLRRIAHDYLSGDVGELTVATPQTHARYSLPRVVETFMKRYPRVRLRLREGNLSQISAWVSQGEADISIASAPTLSYPNLAFLPCHPMHRVVLTRPGHPLLKAKRLLLEDLQRFPIITYDDDFTARAQILQAFQRKQLAPNIVLGTASADTMKTYVKCGLGVAIVAGVAYDKSEDRQLRCIDARHLFESNIINVGIRRNVHLPAYLVDFISLFAPHLSGATIQRTVNGPDSAQPRG